MVVISVGGVAADNYVFFFFFHAKEKTMCPIVFIPCLSVQSVLSVF